MTKKHRRIAVLGATGAVGQRFIQLLDGHPWFEVTTVMASERSVGKGYGEAVHWTLPGGMPPRVAKTKVLPPEPDQIEADLVFSALDADAAERVEPAFRDAGFVVLSNTKSFRQDPEVPLVIPEINSDHLQMVAAQRQRYGGAIVTNPNCSTIGLCLALEPLRRSFGIRQVLVTTLQAISGAGYPGIPSADILDNALPEIRGEEEKLESEPKKLFGRLNDGKVEVAELEVSAQCNRVAIRDGHLLSISIQLERPARLENLALAWDSYRSPLEAFDLPSAPPRPVAVAYGFARPQPLLDREKDGGMTVCVGRLKPCPVLDARFVALVHNTIRGAAGGTILIAELLVAQGMV
jgi:aspartate-semialdehyde dehydrogenase